MPLILTQKKKMMPLIWIIISYLQGWLWWTNICRQNKYQSQTDVYILELGKRRTWQIIK